jgi:predicted dehydrogenase
VKIAVISFAHVHATAYLQLLAQREDVDVVGCDPGHASTPGRGRQLAHESGAEYVETLEEVLAWGADAVVVAAENNQHRRYTEWAAEHGLHVLCEKPLATTVADARAMIDACQAGGVRLMVAYPARFAPAFVQLRAAVASGELGDIRAAHGSNPGKSPVGLREWFGDPEQSGGGAIMDHTVHLADLLDELFDGALPLEVYADANSLLFEDLAVESAGLVSVRYEGDRVATIECGWTQPQANPAWGGLDLTVIGDAAVVEFDAFPPSGAGYVDGAPTLLSSGPDLDALLLDEFIAAIRDDRTPQPDGWSALRSLAVVEAAYASWRTGDVAVVDTDPLVPTPQ